MNYYCFYLTTGEYLIAEVLLSEQNTMESILLNSSLRITGLECNLMDIVNGTILDNKIPGWEEEDYFENYVGTQNALISTAIVQVLECNQVRWKKLFELAQKYWDSKVK